MTRRKSEIDTKKKSIATAWASRTVREKNPSIDPVSLDPYHPTLIFMRYRWREVTKPPVFIHAFDDCPEHHDGVCVSDDMFPCSCQWRRRIKRNCPRGFQ